MESESGAGKKIVDDLLDAADPAKANELSILRVCSPDEARARARAATERALRAVPAIGDGPDAPAPGLPEGIAKAFAEARGAMDSLGSGAGDPDAPSKSAALALLRSLAEDQLSRTL